MCFVYFLLLVLYVHMVVVSVALGSCKVVFCETICWYFVVGLRTFFFLSKQRNHTCFLSLKIAAPLLSVTPPIYVVITHNHQHNT
ncbi:hypothetical protein HanIR_Chr17g0875681 [Helianthus annuus]|nr:hypothetical protein HanIR_Chr17g0875681 [Helianthus annuus]